MKKVLFVALMIGAGLLASGTARADVSVFNVNQQELDASLDVGRSTTEQFDPVRGQSVADRPRPDFDPVPITFGSFQLFPALNVGSYYDSNIYSLNKNQVDDEVWKVNPTMTLASNWGRHAIVITGLGDFNYYVNNDEQNYHGGVLQAEGRYDLAQQTWLSGVAAYQRVTELRGTTNAPDNALGPSEYNLYSGNAEAYRGVGSLKTKLDFDTSYYDYQPYSLIGGGSQNQDTRDRTQNKMTGQVGYDVTQNFQPYLRADYDWRDYTAGGVNSSRGYALDVGSKMDFGGVTTAEAYIGYIAQDYFRYNNGNVTAPDFGADILWNVTTLTSVEAKAHRSIEETNVVDVTPASSILNSQGSIEIQHELRRDTILQASAIYYSLDYQQDPRHDNLYDLGTGVRHFFNRRVYGDLTYDFQRRNTNAPDLNFDRNIGFIRLGVQY